jgi:hypothetical protein
MSDATASAPTLVVRSEATHDTSHTQIIGLQLLPRDHPERERLMEALIERGKCLMYVREVTVETGGIQLGLQANQALLLGLMILRPLLEAAADAMNTRPQNIGLVVSSVFLPERQVSDVRKRIPWATVTKAVTQG